VLRPFRKHQHGMFAYTMKQRHPAMFVEMRLGKCLVTIRRCKLYKPLDPIRGLRVLIVAPNSALGSWETELALENEKNVFTLSGSHADRLANLNYAMESSFHLGEPTWVLMNKEGFLVIPEIANKTWDAVVVDESTFIKNPKAKVTQFFLRNFRKVAHRWILTGTPNPESDLELWPQFAFLDGEAFGYRNFWDWRAKEFQQTSTGFDWRPKLETRKRIERDVSVRAHVLRRRDAGVEPTKEHICRELVLPPEVRRIYDHIESDYESVSGQTTHWNVVKYDWVRQLCGGFHEGQLIWDGKIQEVLSLLTGELKGEQVVIWFHYNAELHAVENALHDARIPCTKMTGATSRESREDRRKRWASGEFHVILVQQAVAQTGMDLSKADTAIYYSESPSLLASKQTEDRILSLAKNTSLLYLYLTVKDSVDTDLHDALRCKRYSSDMTLMAALAQARERRCSTLTRV
jgi:SNF2 family DNA or RNA helicase